MLKKCTAMVPRLSHSLALSSGRLSSQPVHFSFAACHRSTPSNSPFETSNYVDSDHLSRSACIHATCPLKVFLSLSQAEKHDLDESLNSEHEESSEQEKMYFLKATALFFLANVVARLLMKKDKHYKSYGRHD